MKRMSFKEYKLAEYDRYFNSFSEVLDKEDGKSKADDKKASNGDESQLNPNDCEGTEDHDGEQDYDPCKFRQWMEISIAGEN